MTTLKYTCSSCGKIFEAAAFFGKTKCNECLQIEAIKEQGRLNREFQAKSQYNQSNQHDYYVDDSDGPQSIKEELEALENTAKAMRKERITSGFTRAPVVAASGLLNALGPYALGFLAFFIAANLGAGGIGSIITGVIAGWGLRLWLDN